MSLFRRPKKAIVQRRVYSAADDEDHTENSENEGNNSRSSRKNDDSEKMDVDDSRDKTPPPPSISSSDSHRKHDKKSKDTAPDKSKATHKKSSLLSFGDEEEEGEVFQVKKSSNSKKLMKMLDKERRKKKHRERDASSTADATATSGGGGSSSNSQNGKLNNNGFHSKTDHQRSSSNAHNVVRATSYDATKSILDGDNDDLAKNSSKLRQKSSSHISNSSIHTEIRTDDFVLVVRKTETEPNVILNGRAALCAGRDDMSSEDENDAANDSHQHRFNKPDNFKSLLESGAIPDASMIHEARKKRQKARELGDYVAIEETKQSDREKKSRLVREDADDDDASEDERVDMSGITGAKERDERREKFYSVQYHGSDEDSDHDMHEWENQQIRKGVTGAQLMNAQQESAIYSQYLIKSKSKDASPSTAQMSTGNLLEQAYARSSNSEKSHSLKLKTEKKPSGPRMPHEVFDSMKERLEQVKQLNVKHLADIDKITTDLKLIELEELECEQNAPITAAKFRFYQELRGYVLDLIECFDEKVPKIVELEKKAVAVMAKQSNMLIERRRQDVRDQAKEVTQKPVNMATLNSAARKEEDERIRRAAEREGRRTRRRRDRERIDIKNSHLDGMSSDDEVADHDVTIYKNQLKQINAEATLVFEDVTEEFSELGTILQRFEVWRNRDINSYKDTYFSLCLPKIIGPMLRLHLILWNPLDENCKDLEKMEWYETVMKYGFKWEETEAELVDDPDIRLIPTLVEKIVLPKITEFIEKGWDPLSSSQTLRLVNLLRRLIRDYPSLKPTSKYMRALFNGILDKMKFSLDNDVFIPIFPKQLQEAKSSFFQRQFSSALKLFRNLLSWEGILSDSALKEIAILSLLNRYLLSAIRICAPVDAVAKSNVIVNTLPRVWLQQEAIIESLGMFIQFLKSLLSQLDRKNPIHSDAFDKMNKIMSTFHLPMTSTT